MLCTKNAWYAKLVRLPHELGWRDCANKSEYSQHTASWAEQLKTRMQALCKQCASCINKKWNTLDMCTFVHRLGYPEKNLELLWHTRNSKQWHGSMACKLRHEHLKDYAPISE